MLEPWHPVERRALARPATDAPRERLHLLGIELLTVHSTGRARNGLVHECAAHIVSAGVQTDSQAFGAHLDPGGLDIRNHRVEREPRDGVHQYRLAQSRSRAGAATTP